MLSVGLDLHKRYSQVEALEENGERRSAARLVNEFEEIEGFFRSLGEPCRVVLEARWNWGSMYVSRLEERKLTDKRLRNLCEDLVTRLRPG